MKAGQYVDMNDGHGFQRIKSVHGTYYRLEAGGEFPFDDRLEVRDAKEIEFGAFISADSLPL
jgi:hypothetical protein